jgi:hypothetical protein
MATATATAPPAFGWIGYFLRGIGDCVFGLSGQGLAIACQLPSHNRSEGFHLTAQVLEHCCHTLDLCGCGNVEGSGDR